MSDRPRKPLWLLISVATALLLPVLYAAGYLLLGSNDPSTPAFIDRHFSKRLLALAYVPMGIAEAKFRGTEVSFIIAGERLSDPYADSMITFEP